MNNSWLHFSVNRPKTEIIIGFMLIIGTVFSPENLCFHGDLYYYFVGGFEYCFVGLFDSAYDVNWLMEYQYDDRENVMNVVTQNDVMLGNRLVFNDIDGTQILAGVIQELDYSNVSSGFIEASSRINDNWKWRLYAWMFSSDEPTDQSYLLRIDDYIQLSLEYF